MVEDSSMVQDSSLEKLGYTQTLNRVMDLKALVYFGLACIAPGTILVTYGLVVHLTHGMLALTYVVATLAMMFTAFSYRYMVRAYPVSGSVYSYVSRSIHPYVGFLAGWAILMDYLLLPLLNYVAEGVFISAILPIPKSVIIIALIVVVTVLNFTGIKVAATANKIMVIICLVSLAVTIFFSLKWVFTGNGAGTFFDANAFFNAVEFNKPGVGIPAILSGASILALSFLGFDAVTTVSEETIDPEKTVGRALLITCIGAGVAFVLMAYLFQLAWPNAWSEMINVEAGSNELILKTCGSTFLYIGIVTGLIAAVASATAAQASAARILFGMGRDGSLPKFFAHIHPKYKTPSYNILLICAISLTGVVMTLNVATSLVNFGALLGFAFVNVSVIAHYFIRKKQRSGFNILRYLVFPIIGTIICIVLWLNLSRFSKILGFSWLAVGFIVLMIISKFFKKLPPDLKLD